MLDKNFDPISKMARCALQDNINVYISKAEETINIISINNKKNSLKTLNEFTNKLNSITNAINNIQTNI